MRNNKLLQQVIVFAIPILILIGLAIPPTLTSLNGEEIRLQTQPIDPTDLFRGSYVALSYDIETALPSQVSDSIRTEIENKSEGELIKVYVLLTKADNGIYTIKEVTQKKPDSGVYLKGNLEVPYQWELLETSDSYFISYNLNNYYAPGKIAKKIEATTSIKPAVAILKVKNGNAVITDIVTQ